MRILAAVVLAMLPTVASAYSDTSVINSYEKARAYVAKHGDASMKDGFALRLGACDSDECAYDKASSLVAMKGAYKKDYGDQRNLAYCLSTSCKGAIIPNETMGCAWRMVILASGSPELDDSDQMNFQQYCMRTLSGAQLATAKAQAATLFQTVYRREISRDFQ